MGVSKGLRNESNHPVDGDTEVQRGRVAGSGVRAAWRKWEKNPAGLLTCPRPPAPPVPFLCPFSNLRRVNSHLYQLGVLNQVRPYAPSGFGGSLAARRSPGFGVIHQPGKPFSEVLQGVGWHSPAQNRPEPCPLGKGPMGRRQ